MPPPPETPAPTEDVEGFKTGSTERKMLGRVDQVYNKEKRRYEFHRTRAQKTETYKFTKYVIVVRRIIDNDGHPSSVEVDIRGPRLQKALLELNKDVSGFGFSDDPPQIDRKILYHSLEGLEQMLAREEECEVDTEKVFELRAAIQFVYEDFADTFASLKTLLPNNQINFDNLWTLYPPNTVVWGGDSLGHIQAYKCRKTDLVRDKNGMPWLVLRVDYIDSNGKDVGWVKGHTLRMPWFDGVKHIWHLGYIPLNGGPDPELFRARLIAQGKLAMKRHGQQLVEYNGAGLQETRQGWQKFNVHGRVMLDPQTWNRTQPSNNAVPSIDAISMKSLEEDDDKIMLLNSILYGYSLGDKIWGKFAVSQTADAEWNEAAFEGLVQDDDLKSFIRDLVSEHKVRGTGKGGGEDNTFDDIVRDKGRGLVGLLSGPPGVGKTLTAEAVAEVSRRPLYTISSGELGHEPETIHTNLTKILELAEHWDAVVLLDEADVFLAARSDHDLMRNAIVSVFLRELEYYQGVLLLTTNAAPRIDPAFQSRIHFAVPYPELDAPGRARVWRGFVAIAARDTRLEVDIGEEGVRELAGWKMNGRQIKNAVSVAQKVALKRGQPLTVAMIKMARLLSQHRVGDESA